MGLKKKIKKFFKSLVPGIKGREIVFTQKHEAKVTRNLGDYLIEFQADFSSFADTDFVEYTDLFVTVRDKQGLFVDDMVIELDDCVLLEQPDGAMSAHNDIWCEIRNEIQDLESKLAVQRRIAAALAELGDEVDTEYSKLTV